MENEQLVSVETICNRYKVETSFIKSLNEYGLLQLIRVDEIECVDKASLGEIESMRNLYYELNINMEGIDAITHLLNRMREMQKEITALRNRLGQF